MEIVLDERHARFISYRLNPLVYRAAEIDGSNDHLLLVVPVIDGKPLLKLAPAPLPGARKITETPGTGLPNTSVTVATSAAAKAVLSEAA